MPTVRSDPAPVVVMLAPLPMRLVMVGFRSTSASDMPAASAPPTATPLAVPSASATVSATMLAGPLTVTCAPSPMPALTVGVALLKATAPVAPATRPPAAPVASATASWSARASTCSDAPVVSAPLTAAVVPPVWASASTPPMPTVPLIDVAQPVATAVLSDSPSTTTAPVPPAMRVLLPTRLWAPPMASASTTVPLTTRPRPAPAASAVARTSSPFWLWCARICTPVPDSSAVLPVTVLRTSPLASAIATITPTALPQPTDRPKVSAVASALLLLSMVMSPLAFSVASCASTPTRVRTAPLAWASLLAPLVDARPPPEASASTSARLRAWARTVMASESATPPSSSASVLPLARAVPTLTPKATPPMDRALASARASLLL